MLQYELQLKRCVFMALLWDHRFCWIISEYSNHHVWARVVGARRVDGRVFFCLFRGWGGGMITFPELANMVDATQDVGWGGGGMITFPELANMVDATQDVGWGGGGDDNVP